LPVKEAPPKVAFTRDKAVTAGEEKLAAMAANRPSPAAWGGGIQLYAAGRDLKDPLLSPIYGDVAAFPPAILTSGTRDLYLSNTVRMHRKLRAAGIEAVLQLWEGQSHVQYMSDPDAPETREYHDEVAGFPGRHLLG
jgi:acetyl esterase/lipase